ncbi:MAG: endo-1,4-beta-xylanase, partial [Lachnospiraceae bacterium]|nr:endo-1,4-beta-xylanase [Lachnospiraceae bacterium]
MQIPSKYAHRTASKTVKISDRAGAEATVRQKRHAFLFGCSEFSAVQYASGGFAGEEKRIAEARYERLAALMNAVTLPFYWGRFEPERGKPNTVPLKKAAEFFRQKGITLKGHPLCWHTVCADWLMALSNAEILDTQLARITREVREFAGLIDIWDVINETVIMPVFDKYDNGVTRVCQEYGREDLCKMLFDKAREASPNATLLINDFNTSEEYAELIEKLLDMGVKIDVIGIQSHMHQGFWGLEKTAEVLERFARFKLPLHFTEITLISGEIMPPEIGDLNDYKNDDWQSTPDGLARQAEETAAFYEALFAHPLVEAITWWSFNDGLWLNAPAGLITKDSQP